MAQGHKTPPPVIPSFLAPPTPSQPAVPEYGKDFSSPVQDSPTGTPIADTENGTGIRQAPSPADQVGTGRGSKEIAKMQKSLVNLANEVIAQINPDQLADRGSQQGQKAEGRDSFADFLAKYMRNSEVQAVEFSPDPTKTKVSEKEPREASKMSWVMDTMRRIGGQKNEFVVDGIWKERTNAALRNACALANALFVLASSLQVEQNAYSQDQLENLNEAIPQKDTDIGITKKIGLADPITTHIDAIREMYKQIKRQVLQNPKYKDYIEGTKPYITHDSFNITSQELDAIKKQYPNGWNIPTGHQESPMAKITIDDISSLENLDRWIESSKLKLNPYSVLQSIKTQISGGGSR
jgi:hypothetical protein